MIYSAFSKKNYRELKMKKILYVVILLISTKSFADKLNCTMREYEKKSVYESVQQKYFTDYRRFDENNGTLVLLGDKFKLEVVLNSLYADAVIKMNDKNADTVAAGKFEMLKLDLNNGRPSYFEIHSDVLHVDADCSLTR